MRIRSLHIPTLREPPKDAETISHQLLVRAGYIRRIAAGIYSFLPLGVRSVEKVKRIVREEMDRAGAQEVVMPAVIPAELWQESGRWKKYGPELLRVTDRKQAEYCIGPTHEEVVVDLARKDIRSYKQLPVNLYQIQTKFRDEIRPRAGLMRGREFVMKDAYSFDASVAGAHASYKLMYDAYCRIFGRMGLAFRPVEADTGNIGGSMSHEFQVLADSGEDAIVACGSCDFAANVEKAPLPDHAFAAAGATGPARLIDTPGAKTIDSLCKMLAITPDQTIKAVLYMADDKAAVALARGDRNVNEIKVKQALGCTNLQLADAEWFAKTTGMPPGYVGAIGAKNVQLIADFEVKAMPTAVCGANEKQQHMVDVVPARDMAQVAYADLRMAVAGDPCPRCAGALRAFRGIEVGHVFYLGTKYSDAMHATFLGEDGKEQLFEMGCYGIGITRILAAAIEQNSDVRGIRWPVALAPYEVAVLPMAQDGDQHAVAEELYAALRAAGVEAVIDDRDERPGIKFNDADLVGYPVQIVVGKRAGERVVEVKLRHAGAKLELPVDGLAAQLGHVIAHCRSGPALTAELLA